MHGKHTLTTGMVSALLCGGKWETRITRPTAGAPADELLPRKKRKEISQRPVLEILKDKIGMMNSVTNRRQAADHILFLPFLALSLLPWYHQCP